MKKIAVRCGVCGQMLKTIDPAKAYPIEERDGRRYFEVKCKRCSRGGFDVCTSVDVGPVVGMGVG